MKELLEQIQIKIIETNDLSVNEQIGVLEPLFDKVYQICIDIHFISFAL